MRMACSPHPFAPSALSLAAKTQRGEKTLLLAVTLARVPTTFSTTPVLSIPRPVAVAFEPTLAIYPHVLRSPRGMNGRIARM